MCLLARHHDSTTPDVLDVWLTRTKNKLCRALSRTTVPRPEAVLNHRMKLAGDMYQTQSSGATPPLDHGVGLTGDMHQTQRSGITLSLDHGVRLAGDLDQLTRPGTITISEKQGLEAALRGRTLRSRQGLHHGPLAMLDWNNITTTMICRLDLLSKVFNASPIVSSETRSKAMRALIEATADIDRIHT
jgi:hypothetical protein